VKKALLADGLIRLGQHFSSNNNAHHIN